MQHNRDNNEDVHWAIRSWESVQEGFLEAASCYKLQQEHIS